MSGRESRGRGGRRGYHRGRFAGRGRGHDFSGSSPAAFNSPDPETTHQKQKSWAGLEQELSSLDGKSYNAYWELLKSVYYHHSLGFTFHVDKVQGDPYAPPSRARVALPLSVALIPDGIVSDRVKRTAFGDFVTRLAADYIRSKSLDDSLSGGGKGWSGPKGGALNINAPGQEVLERTSCVINTVEKTIELRFTVALPARGRTILGHEAKQILATNLPLLVKNCLIVNDQGPHKSLPRHVETVKNQAHMRGQLDAQGLIAFIANGSVIPRQSGSSSLPMVGPNVIKFESPSSLSVGLDKVDGTKIQGLGVPKGITVLTGGGFHGKSTLLEAIQMGIYNHIPDDGRDCVVTEDTCCKIRAEDGRSVTRLDITPFITSLPGGRKPTHFTSEDASGSTSMAANIQEALELGCKSLLIDEDSSATNLLIRDGRMQALIKNEPITPLVSKARALFLEHGVSTLIVVGGCGDYLEVADCVIGMESYQPRDLTSEAREIVRRYPTQLAQEANYGTLPERVLSISVNDLGSRTPAARGKEFIKTFAEPPKSVNNPAEAETGVSLVSIEQLVEPGQARFIAELLRTIASTRSEHQNAASLMDWIERKRLTDGFDAFDGSSGAERFGDLVFARRFEIGAALNRLRGLHVE